MRGMLNNSTAMTPPAMAVSGDERMMPGQGMSPDTAAPEGAESNVSPEEQNAYNNFVSNGLKVVFNEKTGKALVDRIRRTEDPIQGLAATTVLVVDGLAKKAEQATGQPVADEVLFHGGAEIMSNIAELAQAAGVHDYTPEDQEKAMYMALDMYGTQAMQDGTLDKGGIAKSYEQMVAADKAGEIDRLLPGIEQKAQEIRARGGKQSGAVPAGKPSPNDGRGMMRNQGAGA